MTITNKNSAYILLKDSCKTNSKITSNWRWGNNNNYSSIFENGTDYDVRREKIEKLNIAFCFALKQNNNIAQARTSLGCTLNVKYENWSTIEEKEMRWFELSAKLEGE